MRKQVTRRRGFSREKTLVICFAFAVFLLAITPLVDPDFWWHLAVGRLHFEQHLFPKTDPFSHTASNLFWDDKEWLFGIIIYLVYNTWGINGAIIFKALVVTATFLLLYYTSRSFTLSPLLAVSLALTSAMSCRIVFTERPWLFTVLMEALFLLLIIKARGHNPRLLWFLPVLMILWVNLHPAAIIGVFIIFTYVVEIIVDEIKEGNPGFCRRLTGNSFKRNLVIAFLVTPIAYLINPNTSMRYTALYEIVFKHTKFITSLDETMPASLSQDPYFYVLFLLCAVLLLHRWNRTAVSDMLLVVVLGGLALQWKRNVPLFAVGCIPFLTNSLNAVLAGDRKSPVTNWYSKNVVALEWTGIIALIVSLPLIATSTSFGLGYVGARYPETGIQYVEANKLKGNLFNIYDWGGFHIFWMYPDHRVFIDGRGPDAYTPEIWHEYEQIRDGSDNYDQLLDKYKVEIVFLSTGDRLRNLTEKLDRNARWGCVFRDYVTAIYVRARSENMKIASENNLKKAAMQAMNEGNMERTLELMTDLKRVNPESVEAWLNSGIICAQYLKRYDDAIENFTRVIEIDSANVAARIYLASIYELKGDRNKSIAMLKEVLQIDPANEAARQKLEVMTKK